MFDPLEQFDVYSVKCSWLLCHNNIILIFILIYVIFAFVFLMSNTFKIKKNNLFLIPTIKSYIKHILSGLFAYTKESINRQNMIWSKEKLFVYFIFYYFAFVLIANLAGLIPFLDTITATILVPFFLSITSFIALHFLIARRWGNDFWGFFVPPSVPFLMVPLIFVVELISHMLKCASLAIRIFANLFAGHVLMSILGGSIFAMLNTTSLFLIGLFGPYVIFSLIQVMEYFVCFLQAFVFATLVTLYIGDIL